MAKFGGMGSFNDLVLAPENKHEIKPSEVERANDLLIELRSKIYASGNKLLREEV